MHAETEWVLYHCLTAFPRRRVSVLLQHLISFEQDYLVNVYESNSPRDDASVCEQIKACWECGTIMSFQNHTTCTECSGTMFICLPVISPAPDRVALPSWIPLSVTSVLKHFLPVELCLLFGVLKIWATEVQRRFLYKLRQKDVAVSPPILHANHVLVFCTRLSEVVQGTSLIPRSPPGTIRLSLVCPSLCSTCARPVISETNCLSLPAGIWERALCVCPPRGHTFANRSLAHRSEVTFLGASLGKVVPITTVAKATCAQAVSAEVCLPIPGWCDMFQALIFQLPTTAQAEPLRVLSINCGGTAANIAPLLGATLIHDPDVVALQELWDISLQDEVPLRAYVVVFGTITGPGCGLCFLFHRRIFVPGEFTPKCIQVLSDMRSWLSVLVHHGSGEVVLYTNVHMDPELNATQKEDVLTEIGAVQRKLRPTAAICMGDFNVPRSTTNCIARQLAKGGALEHMKLDYLPGQYTNIVRSASGVTETEIDYVLVSRQLSVEDFHVFPGVCTHGVLVADVHGLSGTVSSFQKRYKHMVTSPETMSSLACLVAVFWWWMSQVSAHPDNWIHAYWVLADRFLFSHSLRRSAEGLMKKGRQLARKKISQDNISAWKAEVQDHLFARGLKLTQEIMHQVSITSHTTSALRLRRSMPQPYPNLTQDTSGKEASELLSAARQQLRFYHLSKGECMNLPVLMFHAQPHDQLCLLDDLPFAILFRQLQDGTWSTDRERYMFTIRSQPKGPRFTANAIRRGLDRGGSDAASLDDVPFSLLRALPLCAMPTLLHYSKLLSLFPDAISNVVLQMGILKGGLSYLFNSYRPIKMGSSFSRLFAGVVHDDVVTRGESLGTWNAGLFSYRKELCPAYMALSARATVALSLHETGECHIIDGDESGAFAVDLSLPSSLVREPVLFVTTDAGHAPGDLRVMQEKGGLGIVFSSGIKVQHRVSLGIRCAAGSSTVLEWLAKILALWMLVRAGFRGRVCLLCDNAAVQLCDFSRWVRTASWFSRLVKWVFQQPIALRVVEFWLPAQHDSGDTGVAAGWQRLADTAATRGLDDPDRYPIPWDSILGVLEDPPSPVCCNGSVVFKLNAFMDRLYDMTLGQSSALGGWVLEQGFDVSTWVRVCHDASVSLSQHRQAAYLRMLPFLPRVYFDVPDCRFCGLFQGNEQSHMCACVELYGRQCRAVRALEELMIRDLGFSVLAAWDTVLRLNRSGLVYWVAVEADVRFSERRATLSLLPGHQVVILTTSGLLWTSQSSPESPGYLTAHVRHQLSRLVLQRMHEGIDSSAPCVDRLSPDPGLSPFAENGPVKAPVSDLLQAVMAWVVRRDPRLTVPYRAGYCVSLPPRVFRDPSPLDYVLYLCSANQCMHQYPRQSRRAVVLCGCDTRPAPVWQVVTAGLGWVLAADHNYSMPQLN